MGTRLQKLFALQKTKMDVLHQIEHQIVDKWDLSRETMAAYYLANQEARQAINDVLEELRKLKSKGS